MSKLPRIVAIISIVAGGILIVAGGVTYFAVVGLLRVPEANAVINRALRMIGVRNRS